MRYWAYINGEVPGSFSAEQLASVSGFTSTTLVCPAEGEIDEKSWKRAGEFEDIANVLAGRAVAASAATSELAAAAAATASVPPTTDVDSMLDSAGSKLFHHVADLMKELENRREERALSVSLQRQVAALKDELNQSRERSSAFELRAQRFAELEESARKDANIIQSLQSSLQAREQAHNEARIALEKMKNELETERRRHAEAVNDLAVRNRLVDKLSKELTDKELSLAKSLGMIRRLEEDLNRLCPTPVEFSPAPAPAEAVAAPEPVARTTEPAPAVRDAPAPLLLLVAPAAPAAAAPTAPAVDLPAYTADDPPAAPPYLEPQAPSEPSKAQQALDAFLKRFFPGRNH
jgi:hypothetical protein